MAKKQKTDLGKRAIYNYHVRNDGNNARVPPAVVDCWYPTSPKQEEILILSKMCNLTKGRDGVQVRISEANLPSLFMTGGYTKTTDGMYVYEQDVVMQRTRSRFHDFAGRGLLEGVIGAPAITFSGLRQLEDLVAFDDSADDVIREFVAAVRENTSAMQSHDQKLHRTAGRAGIADFGSREEKGRRGVHGGKRGDDYRCGTYCGKCGAECDECYSSFV